MEDRYNPVSRTTVNRRLSELASEMDIKIKNKLEKAKTVSVTVDIWTDRCMRGFLGVTAHFIDMDASNPTLQSLLLKCERFTGSHTGERIHDKFEEICEIFNIKHKLDYIVCDNAANMKKAFTVCFPTVMDEDENEVENNPLWEDVAQDQQEEVDAIHKSCRQQRLQCFAHTLQLVVRDGLKETKMLNSAMAKTTKLCSLLHSTCKLKEGFEAAFGPNRSIPSAISTRWNSTFRLVQAVTNLDSQMLNNLLEGQGHKELCLSSREWSQLNELVDILAPFLQATDLTQGEKVVTISAALPCVLSLNSHLIAMQSTARHLVNLVKSLHKSLMHRFQGIFANVKMDTTEGNASTLPFGDSIYMISALLDPSFCFFWLEQDVHATEEVKNQVKQMIMDLIFAEMQKESPEENLNEDNEQEAAIAPVSAGPSKVQPQLFSGYKKRKSSGGLNTFSVHTELMRYITICCDEDDASCLDFWKKHRKTFPRLYSVAMRVLAVPATSAAVERVFSQSGLIMRPHRARMSANTLESLVSLKCNISLI